jgi:ribose-phosphate pyrophosphokinase
MFKRYEIINYPDGSGYVKVNEFHKESIFRLNTYTDLWYLKQFVDIYNHNGLTPDITIPFLLDGQADRRFSDEQPNGLKLVLKELVDMRANFKIFHPHNQEVVEMVFDIFGNSHNLTIIDNSGFIKEVIFSLNGNYPKEYTYLNLRKDNLILMSSDAGGFKPLMKLCDKIGWQGETFSASKSRKYEDGKSKLTQQVNCDDFGGKDILIIDDICVYGGTFKGLSKLLKERNCGNLYLAVSHTTVQNLGEDPVTNYFDKVFTTNSKFDKYWDMSGKQPKNLEIIKMF